jgi:hypothetical protein
VDEHTNEKYYIIFHHQETLSLHALTDTPRLQEKEKVLKEKDIVQE